MPSPASTERRNSPKIATRDVRLLAKAISLKDKGDGCSALAILTSLAAKYPTYAHIQWYLGSVYFHDRAEPGTALPYLMKATTLTPRSERASLGLFHALWALDRQDLALTEMKRYLELADSEDYRTILKDLKDA